MRSQVVGDQNARTQARWDFFICHASDDKNSAARPLYNELRSRGHSVWLDETELTVGDSLRGSIDKGLANCRFGIVILSHAFFRKNWPQYELDGLMDRQQSGAKVVLPVWHGVGHDDIAAHSPSLAGLVATNTAWGISPVVDQLVRAYTVATTSMGTDQLLPQGAAVPERPHFPLSDPDRAHLLNSRPAGWEYLLFADALARGMLEHEPAWRDHQLRLVRPAGRTVTKDEVGPYLSQACDRMVGIIGNVERLLTPTAQEAAFGLPGEPGDRAAIEHLCQRLTAIYGQCLEWAAEIRGTRHSQDFDRLFELAAELADPPIRQFRGFVDRCTTELAKVPELIERGPVDGEPTTIDISLVLTADDFVQREYEQELKRLKRRWRKLH